jgi:hypothetical protein
MSGRTSIQLEPLTAHGCGGDIGFGRGRRWHLGHIVAACVLVGTAMNAVVSVAAFSNVIIELRRFY